MKAIDRLPQAQNNRCYNCNSSHPSDSRRVILIDRRPSGEILSIVARYKNGDYLSAATGNLLPVNPDTTTWMEVPIEPYYHIKNVTTDTLVEGLQFKKYEDAVNWVNKYNLGEDTFIAVNPWNEPVDY